MEQGHEVLIGNTSKKRKCEDCNGCSNKRGALGEIYSQNICNVRANEGLGIQELLAEVPVSPTHNAVTWDSFLANVDGSPSESQPRTQPGTLGNNAKNSQIWQTSICCTFNPFQTVSFKLPLSNCLQ